ncbi:MAG: right-handed parallel beta-helix repeat-containing protein [Treponema sp.]|jgi:hypothetical protein|nr:right-handed parallel beta-helix repeat-containing protein [Treponema sp.]
MRLAGILREALLMALMGCAAKHGDGVVFQADEAFKRDGWLVFAVYAPSPGEYAGKVVYAKGAKGPAEVAVNGVKVAAETAINGALNAGINTISLNDRDAQVTALVLQGVVPASRGATVGCRQYEAETVTTNAEVLPDSRVYREFASEASGRSAVRLVNTGDYVEISAEAAFNALTLRYCIPDAEDGGGIDASLGLYINDERHDLHLTSKYTWVYGTFPWTNAPDESGHHFFDDVHLLLPQTLSTGTRLRLQKDAADTAAYYLIDLVELEEVAPPAQQPANALSITDYGAIADDGEDDKLAFLRCVQAAGKAGKEVWIPAGEFSFNGAAMEITVSDTVIRGAGMWHSVLHGLGAGFKISAHNVSFYDFGIIGEETRRDDNFGLIGFAPSFFSNTFIQNVWIEHVKVGVWANHADALYAAGCRIRNTFADGVNLCGGTSNSMVEQCAIRNTGDDALALWSSSNYDRPDRANTIRHNTAGLQWLANNVAVYGGVDNIITDNLLHDTVCFGAGINVSTNFTPHAFDGALTIAHNTLQRCGSRNYDAVVHYGAIWVRCPEPIDATIVIQGNEVSDATYHGLSIEGNHRVREVLVTNNRFESRERGIDIGTGISGTMTVKDTIFSGVLQNRSEATFTITGL